MNATQAQQDVSMNSKPDDFAEQVQTQVFKFPGEFPSYVYLLQLMRRRVVISERNVRRVPRESLMTQVRTAETRLRT